MKLKNKNVVLVGGNGNIGKYTFLELIKQGANVAVLDLSFKNLEKLILKNKIQKKKYLFIKVDITKKEQIINAKNELKEKFKRLDVLINHAHYKGNNKLLEKNNNFFKSFEDYPFEEWVSSINTNLNALFLITQVFVGEMKKNKKGVIINTSSTYGLVSPNPSIYGNSGINSPISYATTKSAIIGFTKYLAIHLAKYNIRVNCISPGGVKNKNQSRRFIKNYSNLTPMKRMAKNGEYASSIIYLSSDDSSYMTGANLVIDGGWTAW